MSVSSVISITDMFVMSKEPSDEDASIPKRPFVGDVNSKVIVPSA